MVGRLWKEALSKLRLKFSLQMALHAPALFSARLEKRGPLVTEKQFFSLLYFCIEPDETVRSEGRGFRGLKSRVGSIRRPASLRVSLRRRWR